MLNANRHPHLNGIKQNALSRTRRASHASNLKVNCPKDLKTVGIILTSMGSKDTWKGKYRKMSKREAHWKRRPVTGIYSVPSSSEIASHRRSQRKRKDEGIGWNLNAIIRKGLMVVSVATCILVIRRPNSFNIRRYNVRFLRRFVNEAANESAGGNLVTTLSTDHCLRWCA